MENDVFYAMGILWSSSKEYYKEIMLKLAKEYKIEQIAIYNLKDKYADFIIECYQHDEDVISDGYIDEKIERLLQDDNTTIIAFTLEIENPKYKNDSNGNKQCIQARRTKESIRETFSKKIHNYFLDNIIHIADNDYESKILENLFNKYQKFAKKLYEKSNP